MEAPVNAAAVITCEICAKTFTVLISLYRHKRNVHLLVQKSKAIITAMECYKTFKFQKELVSHINVMHREN